MRGSSGLDPRLSGPRGQSAGPTPWPASQGLRRFGLSPGCHASRLGGKAQVVGGRSTRPAGVTPGF
jgi:hypothetical protein